MPGTPFTERELASYADSLLDSAGVKEGDIVSCRVIYPSQLWLSEALADAARARGARFEAMCEEGAFEDPDKMSNLIKGRAVFLQLSSFSPSEDAAQQYLPGPYKEDWDLYNAAQDDNSLRWNVAMSPNAEWAKAVYPDLDPETAYRQLGQDLLSFMRKRASDAPDAWERHIGALKRRAEKLDELGIRELRFSGPNTELKMSVLDGAHFLPVEWNTKQGDRVCVNSPTEEVFTTPDAGRVEGTFRSSRPLVLGGEVITNITGRIESGELVDIRCEDERQTQLLRRAFLERPGMNRLGEVGLVDQSGPIAQSGRIYFNNIIDENAGAHLGFGNSYDIALTEEGRAAGAAGNTGAAGHLDIIIGDSETDIYGIDAQGREIPLIRDGAWQL